MQQVLDEANAATTPEECNDVLAKLRLLHMDDRNCAALVKSAIMALMERLRELLRVVVPNEHTAAQKPGAPLPTPSGKLDRMLDRELKRKADEEADKDDAKKPKVLRVTIPDKRIAAQEPCKPLPTPRGKFVRVLERGAYVSKKSEVPLADVSKVATLPRKFARAAKHMRVRPVKRKADNEAEEVDAEQPVVLRVVIPGRKELGKVTGPIGAPLPTPPGKYERALEEPHYKPKRRNAVDGHEPRELQEPRELHE
jgi:hypothetical protein